MSPLLVVHPAYQASQEDPEAAEDQERRCLSESEAAQVSAVV